jgi:Fe2+ transport system protein FeoA
MRAMTDLPAVRPWRRWLRRERSCRQAVHSEPETVFPVAPGEYPLSAMGIGERNVVCRVSGSGPIRQRLLELGVTSGATVEVIRFAPLGYPIEVRVRGYHLSLRRQEAESIWVRREEHASDSTDAPGAAGRGPGGQSE